MSAKWVVFSFLIFAQATSVSHVVLAQEQNYTITIKNNRFEPATLHVKAGVKFKLTVTNTEAKAAEFEISELNREKIVAAGSSSVLYIGPLEPGTYQFFDDFNQSNRGQIIAR
jgi:plastocyanin